MSQTCRIILFAVSLLIGGREVSSSILSHFDFCKQQLSLAGDSDDYANWLLDNESFSSEEDKDFDHSSIQDYLYEEGAQQFDFVISILGRFNRTVELSFPSLPLLFRNLRL